MDRTCFSSVGDSEVTGIAGQPWRFAYREALSPYIFTRVLMVIGLYMVAYVAICPLGTNALWWFQRLACFAICAALVAPLCHAEYAMTLYLVRSWAPGYIMVALGAYLFVAASTSTAVTYGIDSIFYSELAAYGFATAYTFMILSVGLCSAVVHWLVSQRVRNEHAGRPATEPEPAEPSDAAATVPAGVPAEPSSKFLDRLPREVGRDIIWLKMNDHYVDVVTTGGQCAVLMRFADSIAELGDIGGRVHRSHWVAWSHVEGWERRNQRRLLRLTGGHMVPVSRTYFVDVRAALERHRSGAGPAPRTF